MNDKKYITTFDQCSAAIDSDLVCPKCGNHSIVPLETVDNSRRPTFWSGCEECCIFSLGVKESVYKISKDIVINRYITPYKHLGNMPDKIERLQEYDEWVKSQISGAITIVDQVLKLNKIYTHGN